MKKFLMIISLLMSSIVFASSSLEEDVEIFLKTNWDKEKIQIFCERSNLGDNFLRVYPMREDLRYNEGDRASFVIAMDGRLSDSRYKIIPAGFFPKSTIQVDLKQIGDTYRYDSPILDYANKNLFTVEAWVVYSEMAEKIYDFIKKLKLLDGNHLDLIQKLQNKLAETHVTIEKKEFQLIVNDTPNAIITSSTITGYAPLSVTFSASESMDDGHIAEFRWVFDDGSTDELGKVIEKVFANVGTYTVTLIVTDEFGLKGESSIQITVNENPNNPPALDSLYWFNVSDGLPTLGFVGIGSILGDVYDPDGDEIVSVEYKFEDDLDWTKISTEDCTTPEYAVLYHVYFSEGPKTISARVTDSRGASKVVTSVINFANNKRPVPKFTAASTSTATLTFESLAYDLDGNEDIILYRWLFGDGTPEQKGANLTTITHSYPYDQNQVGDKYYKGRFRVRDSQIAKDQVNFLVRVKDTGVSEIVKRPVAIYEVDKIVGLAPLTVNFNSNRSFMLGEGTIVSAHWYTGDDDSFAFGDKVNPTEIFTHTFNNPGTYDCSLMVVDEMGNTDTVHFQLFVMDATHSEQELNADITAYYGGPYALSFDSETTKGLIPNGNYMWNYDDFSGTFDGRYGYHAFDFAGTKNIALSVIDIFGKKSVQTKSIKVTEQNEFPSVSFMPSLWNFNENQSVNFSSVGMVSDPHYLISELDFFWRIGNGNVFGPTPGLEEILGQLFSNGFYQNTLVVTNPDNQSGHIQQRVGVYKNNQPGLVPYFYNSTQTQKVRVGVAPFSVVMDASSSFDPDGDINNSKFFWEFGDYENDAFLETFDIAATVTYTFDRPGEFYVGTTMKSEDGDVVFTTNRIIVIDSSSVPADPVTPTAAFDISGSGSFRQINVLAASNNPGGNILFYDLEISDGTFLTHDEMWSGGADNVAEFYHNFMQNGVYTVKATVYDSLGSVSTIQSDIVITDASKSEFRNNKIEYVYARGANDFVKRNRAKAALYQKDGCYIHEDKVHCFRKNSSNEQ